MVENTKQIICKFLGCTQPAQFLYGNYQRDYCKYHDDGGFLGSGEPYEQYQIIEQDFIDFIKYVPLTKDHFKVYSPILRDILIRVCVQIEIFFKEWAKEECTERNDCSLMEKYNKKGKNNIPKKERNWTIKDYFYFKECLHESNAIHVMPLDEDIKPFSSWTKESPPVWWKAYNGIKHNGHLEKNESSLENALFALSGLFLMQCENYRSKSYLRKFTTPMITNTISSVYVEFPHISTPIDSKKYLFKLVSKYGNSDRIELITRKLLGEFSKDRQHRL